MMIFTETNLAGAYTIDLKPVSDNRGWFVRSYCRDEFRQIGHQQEWLQINHSHTNRKGSIRGMHFQYPPHQEIKLVRCIRGSVYDVIVDIRKDSPTFLQWVSVELSAENLRMIYIPQGFAHGFQTLTDDAELIYQHSNIYEPGHEGGLRYDDDRLNIRWPLPVSVISDRDSAHPLIEPNFKGI